MTRPKLEKRQYQTFFDLPKTIKFTKISCSKLVKGTSNLLDFFVDMQRVQFHD